MNRLGQLFDNTNGPEISIGNSRVLEVLGLNEKMAWRYRHQPALGMSAITGMILLVLSWYSANVG